MKPSYFIEPPLLLGVLPQRPRSAVSRVHASPRTARRRPLTARVHVRSSKNQSKLVPCDVALTEASLREAQQVQVVEPILNQSVEIHPTVLKRPRGIRNAEYFHARGTFITARD